MNNMINNIKTYSMKNTILGGERGRDEGWNVENGENIILNGCVMLPISRLTKAQRRRFNDVKVSREAKEVGENIQTLRDKFQNSKDKKEYKPIYIDRNKEWIAHILDGKRAVVLNRERYNFIKSKGYKVFILLDQDRVEFKPLALAKNKIEGMILPVRVSYEDVMKRGKYIGEDEELKEYISQ